MKMRRILAGIFLILFGIFFFTGCKTGNPDNILEIAREPVIEPDYSGVTIPRNIAPMNFIIKENGRSFKIVVSSSKGSKLSITSSKGIVEFPLSSWKKLLAGEGNEKIGIEVYSENEEGKVMKFKPLYLNVISEPADPYLCYRLLYPSYELWYQIKIVQRCIENFSESSLIENQLIDNNCINCHAFRENNPENFLFHVRGSLGSTITIEKNKITKRNLKTKEMISGAVYPSWHPGSRFVAFSSNNVIQGFHAIPGKNIEVSDLSASMLLYDLEKNEMLPASVNDTSMYLETYPEWSPDGKYLYYCRAKKLKGDADLKNIRYALVRNAFNQTSRAFDSTEVICDAPAINKSISFPRISPDGKYLVFVLHDYGTFSIWHKEADLYLLNLHDRKVNKMDINSEETESYHSWSTNGKWLVFSSKRGDGLTAKPYFSYFGSPDTIGKPFVLPQKDPTLYQRMILTFNKPEFVTGKINIGIRNIARVIRGKETKAIWAGVKK